MDTWRQREIEKATNDLLDDKIVVVSGLRGSGKSVVLEKIADNLVDKEGTEEAVVKIDLEDPRSLIGKRG